MKKTTIIFVSLLLAVCLSVNVCAAAITTTPQESAQESTEAVSGDGMIYYESDMTLPLTVCLFAALGFIVYGIVKIKQSKEEK